MMQASSETLLSVFLRFSGSRRYFVIWDSISFFGALLSCSEHRILAIKDGIRNISKYL